MQLKHALLPIAVLAVSGLFLAKRQFAAAEKRQHMAIYRETIQAVTQHREENRVAAAAKAAENAKNPAPAVAVTRASIDLKALAKAMGDMRNGGAGMPDMQAMLKVQKTILALSVEDLSGLISDAAKLDVPPAQRNSLLMTLLQGLGQKDAKAAVLAGQSLSSGLSGNDRNMFTMGGIRPAFAMWATKDPLGAQQWYDAQLAAGHFENKGLNDVSMEQTQFESGLLPALAGRDPAAARDRLMAMTEAQRAAVLSQSGDFSADSTSRKTFASLVRGTLSPEKQAETLANAAAGLQRGDYLKNVSQFLTDVAATPSEKAKILPQVAGSSLRDQVWGGGGPPTVENTAALREWMETQSPGSSGKLMGESLASVAGSGKFSQADAAALVGQLYDAHPSDDLITAFTEKSGGGGNPALYQTLASKIQDPARRQAALDLLSSRK